MSTIREFSLKGGRSVLVEVAGAAVPAPVPDTKGMQHAGAGAVLQRVQRELSEAIADVRPVVEALMDGLQGVVERADEVSASFAIKLAAGGNVIVANGSAEANFELSVTWSRARGKNESSPA